MADAKITELAAQTTFTGTDVIPIVDTSGTPTTKKVTITTLDGRYLNTAGDTTTGDLTFGARAILPMGEISYFNMTGTAVTISTQSDGSTNMVVCAPTTTLNNDSGFDNGGSNNGRLRYIGTTTKMFHVACTISIAPVGANDTFVFGIAKGGTVQAASKVLVQAVNSAADRSTAMHLMVELATNDYLELYVGNTTDADDVTIHALNLFAMGM